MEKSHNCGKTNLPSDEIFKIEKNEGLFLVLVVNYQGNNISEISTNLF